MEQAPRWLPYRVRQAVDQWRINRALRGIDRIGPVPADEADGADAEVFMLVCRRDLRLGALAMMSLLHQRADVKLAVTVIDDGSLTPADRVWFDTRIPGVRWQRSRDRAVLDHPQMKCSPRACSLYLEPGFPHMPKLVHPMLTARTRRVVVMDTDTCFFRSPQTLLEYCRGESDRPCYLHDHQDESSSVPVDLPSIFGSMLASFKPGGRSLRLRHWFFNAGLLAYRPGDFDLGLAEQYLDWLARAPAPLGHGKYATWFGGWTREQTIYLLLFGCGPIEARPLGDDYWLGGAEGRVFNHFLRFYLVRKSCLMMLHGMIERLALERSG